MCGIRVKQLGGKRVKLCEKRVKLGGKRVKLCEYILYAIFNVQMAPYFEKNLKLRCILTFMCTLYNPLINSTTLE